MDFDLLVLGGGSGGIATAVRAARYGAKVAVVEENNWGGTCVNLGCVPKKLMYNAASMHAMIEKSVCYGFSIPKVHFDWHELVTKRNAYIAHLRTIYADKLSTNHIKAILGKGILVDSKTVEVNNKSYTANHILIATGGEPASDQHMAGVEHAIDSDGFFAMDKQPEKVAIIGGGYIGVELSGILHALGTQTHLLLKGDYPLSRFDAVLGQTLMEIMQQQGMHVHPQYEASDILLQENGKKTLRCHNGSKLTDLDAVILAIGRKPRTFDLNLASVGVTQDKRGLIAVDAWQNTSVSGIYAIGDVTSAPALTPVSIAAGRKLADRLFGHQKEAHLDYDNICSVIFTHPPIGSVGLSEQEALEKYGRDCIKIWQKRFIPLSDALSAEKMPTVMKLITLGESEKIIGLHVIGEHADEMLQGFGVAVKMGACKQDFDATVGIHPTSAEEWLTM